MNLFAAHRQWANRPEDERFETVEALHEYVSSRRNLSHARDTEITSLRIEPKADDIIIRPNDGPPIAPTHWSFGQLCSLIGGNAGYLRKLPAELVAKCLNFHLDHVDREQVKLMTLDDPSAENNLMQAVNSTTYGRIWDAWITEGLVKLKARSEGKWFNPPDWSGKPSGLYAGKGAEDVFAFLIDGGSIVNAGRTLDGKDDTLHRGFYVWNSEVGKKGVGYASFYFEKVCGNHIIWNATGLKVVQFKHSLHAPEKFASILYPALQAHMTASVVGEETALKKAKDLLLPKETKDFIEWGMKRGLSKSEVVNGQDTATREVGDCRTLWQFVQGLTRYSRTFEFADAREDLDRRAGALLDMVA